jgi:hypothetical protein
MYYKIQRKISKHSKTQICCHYWGLFVSGLFSSNYSYLDYFNMILVKFELRNFEYVSEVSDCNIYREYVVTSANH